MPPTIQRVLPIIGIVAVMVIGGGYEVACAIALASSTMSPMVFAFLRDAGASVILTFVAVYKELQRPPDQRNIWPSREDHGAFLAIGLLGVYGAQGFGATAVHLTTPSFVASLAPATPIFALAFSLLAGTEIMVWKSLSSWVKLLGTLCTLGGVAIAIAFSMESDSNTFKASRNLPVGVIYTLLARCCAASFALVQKTILHKYRSRVVAAWTYLVGTAALLVGISPVAHEASDWQTTWQGALALAYAILLASALNFTIISYVNKRLNPIVLTAFYPLESVSAAVFGYLLLDQPVSIKGSVGFIVVVFGLLLVLLAKYVEARAVTEPYTSVVFNDGAGHGDASHTAVDGVPGSPELPYEPPEVPMTALLPLSPTGMPQHSHRRAATVPSGYVFALGSPTRYRTASM